MQPHSALSAPLLPAESSPRRTSSRPLNVAALRSAAHARLRRCAVAALSASKEKQRASTDPGRPSLEAARAYAHFFLPKTADGKLLPLRCTEAEFTAHVGDGVSIYMQFVRATGTMFTLATIIALPQFYANAHGRQLGVEWPWGYSNASSSDVASSLGSSHGSSHGSGSSGSGSNSFSFSGSSSISGSGPGAVDPADASGSPACAFDDDLHGLVGRVMSTVGFRFERPPMASDGF